MDKNKPESRCIVFTDIKESSNLWKKYPNIMLSLLEKHENQLRLIVKYFKGQILKTIGDSLMIEFPTIKHGILFAYVVCLMQKRKPIYLGNSSDKIELRIGMCYGVVQYKYAEIQGCKLKDFFGETVNLASRMESKVSKVGGFALCLTGKTQIDDYVLRILSKLKQIKNTEIIKFTDCKSNNYDSFFKRSGKLICKDISILKGVGDVVAYSCFL